MSPVFKSSSNLVLGALLLEPGSNHDRFPILRQNEGEESFATRPLDAGEVRHVRARLDQDGRVPEIFHEALRLVAALGPLGFAYRERCVG